MALAGLKGYLVGTMDVRTKSVEMSAMLALVMNVLLLHLADQYTVHGLCSLFYNGRMLLKALSRSLISVPSRGGWTSMLGALDSTPSRDGCRCELAEDVETVPKALDVVEGSRMQERGTQPRALRRWQMAGVLDIHAITRTHIAPPPPLSPRGPIEVITHRCSQRSEYVWYMGVNSISNRI